MESLELTGRDGIKVPIDWFPAVRPHSVVVFIPALGVRAKLYSSLGEGLAARGCAVCVLEQRGHGRSSLRPARGCNFGFAAFLDHDIPLILDWLDQMAPGVDVILGGHSMGGHLATIYTGLQPAQISRVLHVATSFPYFRDFPNANRRRIRLLCGLIPVLNFVLGYYPGDRVGFGHREFAQLMSDWREWALTGSFDFGGRRGLAGAVSGFEGPVLSIGLDRDDYSAESGVLRALSPFVNAPATRVQLGAKEQGEFLGHFQWARNPAGLVKAIDDWLTLR